jgi:hypothetical protein
MTVTSSSTTLKEDDAKENTLYSEFFTARLPVT